MVIVIVIVIVRVRVRVRVIVIELVIVTGIVIVYRIKPDQAKTHYTTLHDMTRHCTALH